MIISNINSDKRPIDIVFISPSNKKLGHFYRFVPRSIPLGITILSSYLLKNGYNAQIIDEEIIKIDMKFLIDKMKRMITPKIFGISTMTTNSVRAYNIAKMIKLIDKDSIVIMGGIHPTVLPDEVLNSGYVDFVVRGEGERAILALVEKFKFRNKNLKDIKDIAYFNEKRDIIFNEVDNVPFDINELPIFPYDIFDKRNYDLGFILSSRGCPFDCIFCSQKAITKRRYRPLNKEIVIEELDYLINKLGQKNITFFDDYFTGDKKRVFELCKMIRNNGLHKKCSFGVQTRGDSVNKEILIEMKQSGFDSLMFGFETSSDHLMDIINKQETVEDNIKAIKLAREIGFTVEATFIFGFPEETYKDRINAFQIAKALIDRARFNNATPYPGTKLYMIAHSEGRLNIEKGWENFSSVGAITTRVFKKYVLPYCPEGTKPNDLIGDVFLANLLFYFNLSNIRRLFNIKKSGSGKWFEIPKQKLLNPLIWFDIFILTLNSLLKAIFFIVSSRECRRFFLDSFFQKKNNNSILL